MYVIKHKIEDVYLKKSIYGAWYSLVSQIDKARIWNNKPSSVLKKIIVKYDRTHSARVLGIGWGDTYISYNAQDFEIRQIIPVLV